VAGSTFYLKTWYSAVHPLTAIYIFKTGDSGMRFPVPARKKPKKRGREMAYKPNVGGVDLLIRAGFGLTTTYLVFFSSDIISDPLTRWIFGFLGTVFLLTAVFRFCPFYRVVGFNTARPEPDEE